MVSERPLGVKNLLLGRHCCHFLCERVGCVAFGSTLTVPPNIPEPTHTLIFGAAKKRIRGSIKKKEEGRRAERSQAGRQAFVVVLLVVHDVHPDDPAGAREEGRPELHRGETCVARSPPSSPRPGSGPARAAGGRSACGRSACWPCRCRTRRRAPRTTAPAAATRAPAWGPAGWPGSAEPPWA